MDPRRLVALYPAAWRQRYGDEFLALLEDRPPSGLQLVDIAWGAVDAHLFPQAPEGRFRMFTRLAGAAALAAGLMLAVTRFTGLAALGAGVALLLGFVPLQVDLVGGMGSVAVAAYTVFYPLALVGSIGIHLRLTRVRPNVAWPAFVAIVFGGVVGSSSVTMSMWGGGIPGSNFGLLQAIGLWVGSAVMGAAILAIGVIPRPVGVAFIIGSAVAMIGPIVGDALPSSEILTALSRSGVVIYALGWIVAGVSLQFAASEPDPSDPLTT